MNFAAIVHFILDFTLACGTWMDVRGWDCLSLHGEIRTWETFDERSMNLRIDALNLELKMDV